MAEVMQDLKKVSRIAGQPRYLLRAHYAMPGTNRAYASAYALRDAPRTTMPYGGGTDSACAGVDGNNVTLLLSVPPATCLRAPSAVCGTERAYGATRTKSSATTPCTMLSTRYCTPLPAYALPMQCPVLICYYALCPVLTQ
eukprot:3774966-Rhodomonas_salina.3